MSTIRPAAAYARPVLGPSSRTLAARAAARRTLFSPRRPERATQDWDLNKLNAQRRDYEQHRTAFLAAGAVAGVISFIYTAWKLKQALAHERDKDQQAKEAKARARLAVKCDASIPTETFKTEAGEKRKVVVHDDEGREVVPTGNDVVPAFPRLLTVDLPASQSAGGGGGSSSPIAASVSDEEGVEFTLVGLGMRSVTFIGFHVYLVGFYVATQDIARLQQYLVRKINPVATTLIPAEKEALRTALLDATEGEQTWDALLREAGCRSAFRIMPVRDTDFHHLRDGFVRAIQARSQRDKACADEAFGAAMKDFKGLFNRGSVPKRKELLLCRNGDGSLAVLYGDGHPAKDARRAVVGVVHEERLSRLLWLNYLAGNKVASEAARQNIIEGVMEFVQRPVGTVAAQVL
ncbi:hypothetical protein CDD83_3427 [Cordyceps sp. RAO-2017]|nr:hypothetical protein CDD83_3427 [Cordyceps sp. RAO-2017]